MQGKRSAEKQGILPNRMGGFLFLLVLLLLPALLTACSQKTVRTETSAVTVVPPTPEPKFDRDAVVFGDDVEMKDVSDFNEEFRAAGIRVIEGKPNLNSVSPDTLQSVLNGKNIRLLKLDSMIIPYLEKIGLGRFGIEIQNAVLGEKPAGILAGMENCRALGFFDVNDVPIPQNIAWPHVRSLQVYSSWLERQDQPLSGRFPALKELIVIQNTARKPDWSSMGLPETLESIEFKTVTISDLSETAAMLGAADAKSIPSVRFINGKSADSYDPKITDQRKAEYERTIFLTDIIDEMNENFEKNKGKIAKKEISGIGELQLPENARILLIDEADLSVVSYKGDNEKIRAALTDDPKECDVLFIVSSVSGSEPGMVIAGSGGRAPAITVHRLYAVDMAAGEVYGDSMWFSPNLGSISEEQKKNNELFREKGVWGFIEPLF